MTEAAPPTALEALDAFVAALNAGDLVRAVARLSREACLVTPDATVIRGRSDVAGALKQFFAIGFRAHLDLRSAIEIGEVVLVSDRWTTRVGGSGSAAQGSARGTVVLRMLEGRWKILLAAPWGWAEQSLGPAPRMIEQIAVGS